MRRILALRRCLPAPGWHSSPQSRELTLFEKSPFLTTLGVTMLKDDLLAVLRAEPGGSAGFAVAWVKLNQKVGYAVQQSDLMSAISELVQAMLIRECEGQNETRLTIRGAAAGATPPLPPAPPPPPPGHDQDPTSIPEAALMRPALGWIQNVHAPTYSLKAGGHPTFVVGDTSRGGAATGRWTKPDITVASVRRYRYTNLRRIELTGYELKKAGSGSITAVHEALAHKRYVHSAYLLVYAPVGPLAPEISLSDLKAECARHGVGLITFVHPNDQDSFEVHLQARVDDIDPARVDEFISNQMQDSEADIRRLMEA